VVQKTDTVEVEIEDYGPPEWRTVLNRRADLGESLSGLGGWGLL
jgi:hypothetical protein